MEKLTSYKDHDGGVYMEIIVFIKYYYNINSI